MSKWTEYESETICNANDADDLVRVWTAQLHVIRRLRAHERFTEVRAGDHWAEFTIPASEWNPATGAKRKGTPMTPEQREASIARLAEATAARLSRRDTAESHVQTSDGASPVPEYPPTPESEFSS